MPLSLEEVNKAIQAKQKEVDIALARKRLLHYTTYTFDGEYEVNWHHELIADEIDNWIESDDPYNLLIQVPPRHGKSELCSRRLPGYLFGRRPEAEICFASYAANLAATMSRDAQRVMLSNEYRDVFPNCRLLTKGMQKTDAAIRRSDEFSVINLQTMKAKGSFLATGIGGMLTGRGADFGIIDDPFKNRKEAESETVRENVISWYMSTFRTRLEKGGRILMLLTRWHLYDLAGWVINKMKSDEDADTWKVVSLPAVFEKDQFTHERDHRKPGEPLWPGKYDNKALRKIKASLTGYEWLSLFQQKPAPPGGAVIKRDWLNVIEPTEVPPNVYWVRYWDLAVTAKTSADHTASVQVGVDKYGNIYVRRIIWEQESWPVIKSMLKVIGIQERLPVGIEAVGTQKGFVQDLHTDPELMNVPIYEFDEDTDKLTRALPWIAKAEAGKFYIVRGKNVDTYIDELVEFTGKGDNADDQVDATSGGYRMLGDHIEPEIEVVGEYG